MFNPYHKWLGIPPEKCPPTHYRLLGVSSRERDAEVIEEAAIRQSAHLRAYQVGEHAEACAKLLEEIARARATLLDSEKRRRYDAGLKASKEGITTARPAPILTSTKEPSYASIAKGNRFYLWAILWAVAGFGTVVIGGLSLIKWRSREAAQPVVLIQVSDPGDASKEPAVQPPVEAEVPPAAAITLAPEIVQATPPVSVSPPVPRITEQAASPQSEPPPTHAKETSDIPAPKAKPSTLPPRVTPKLAGLDTPRPAERLAGTWRVAYTNGAIRTYSVYPAGKVLFHEEKRYGWVLDGDILLLDFKDDKIERLTFAEDGRLFVEHFSPKLAYLSGRNPLCTGIGTRVAEAQTTQRKKR